MMEETAQVVADTILGAYKARTPVPPVREIMPGGTIELAYLAQEINTARRLDEGPRLVGRKIGLTSLAVQRQLGVSQPDYGMLFDDMAVPDGWDVPADQLIQHDRSPPNRPAQARQAQPDNATAPQHAPSRPPRVNPLARKPNHAQPQPAMKSFHTAWKAGMTMTIVVRATP